MVPAVPGRQGCVPGAAAKGLGEGFWGHGGGSVAEVEGGLSDRLKGLEGIRASPCVALVEMTHMRVCLGCPDLPPFMGATQGGESPVHPPSPLNGCSSFLFIPLRYT